MSTAARSRTIVAESLTASGFAEYGDVIEPPATPGRRTHLDALSHIERPFVLSTTTATPTPMPVEVAELERHPHSSQTFLPLSAARWLIIVASSPSADEVRAFVVPGETGVTIGRGIWHHGLTVLDAPGSFAVMMWKGGVGDDEFRDIEPLTVSIQKQ